MTTWSLSLFLGVSALGGIFMSGLFYSLVRVMRSPDPRQNRTIP